MKILDDLHFPDIAGVIFIVSAIFLAFANKPYRSIIIFSILGFALLAMNVVHYMNVNPNGLTFERKLEIKKEINSAVGSKAAELEAALFKIDDFIKEQEKFNMSIVSNSSSGSANKPGVPAPKWSTSTKPASPETNNNASYKVIVYYKPARIDQARAIQRSLLANGFKSSAIQSDLSEIDKSLIPAVKQHSGMTSIVGTITGFDILDAVEKITADTLPDAIRSKITVDREDWEIENSDVEIFLF